MSPLTPGGWSLVNIPQVCQFMSRRNMVCSFSPTPKRYWDGSRVEIWMNMSLKVNVGS